MRMVEGFHPPYYVLYLMICADDTAPIPFDILHVSQLTNFKFLISIPNAKRLRQRGLKSTILYAI